MSNQQQYMYSTTVVGDIERKQTSELDNPPLDSTTDALLAPPPPAAMMTPALRFFDFALEEARSISTFGHLRAPPCADIAVLRIRVPAPSVCCAAYSLVIASRSRRRSSARARHTIQQIQILVRIPFSLVREFLAKGVILDDLISYVFCLSPCLISAHTMRTQASAAYGFDSTRNVQKGLLCTRGTVPTPLPGHNILVEDHVAA